MSDSTVIKPTDLRKITDDMEMSKVKEALDRRKKEQDQENELRAAFMGRELRPDAVDRFNNMVRRAAEQGHSEIEILRFPAEYCRDRGRAINNFDPAWPETLTGIARRGYEAFKQHLEPQGYKMRAQILNYPDGNLGETGLYITW